MLSAILAIVAALVVVAAVAWFFYDNFAQISALWEWGLSTIQQVLNLVPSWLLPFCFLALMLAALGLIVKLL